MRLPLKGRLVNARSSATIFGRSPTNPFSTASLAAMPSMARRTSSSSVTSEAASRRRKVPRPGSTDTIPSRARSRRASRTGVRPMSIASAIARSESGTSNETAPSRSSEQMRSMATVRANRCGNWLYVRLGIATADIARDADRAGLVAKDLRQKDTGSLALRRREKRLWRARLDDFTGIHEDDPVGHPPRKAHLMGDDDHGHTVACQIGHDVQNLLDHLRIQRGCRLVKEHDDRIHGKCARDRHAL